MTREQWAEWARDTLVRMGVTAAPDEANDLALQMAMSQAIGMALGTLAVLGVPARNVMGALTWDTDQKG